MDKWTTAPLRSRSCPLAHSLYYDCCNDCCGATLTERRRRYLNQGRSRVLTNPSTSSPSLPPKPPPIILVSRPHSIQPGTPTEGSETPQALLNDWQLILASLTELGCSLQSVRQLHLQSPMAVVTLN